MRSLLFSLVLVFSFQSLALEQYESNDLGELRTRAQQLLAKYKSSEVLIVYDLDNTLLAMNTDLGSDQWFDWQSAIIKEESNPDRVAATFDGLLKVQGVLFNLGSMRLTQMNAPQLMSELTALGVEQILLTSRGPDFRDVTEREIVSNQLPVWDSKKQQHIEYGFPYNVDNLGASCLTEADKTQFKLGTPRLMSTGKNIILSSGQHKGMVLKTHLCKIKKAFKAILFADDKVKNIDAMVAAYGAAPGVELITYRYAREDQRVNEFHNSNKNQAKADWQDLYLSLKVIFNSLF